MPNFFVRIPRSAWAFTMALLVLGTLSGCEAARAFIAESDKPTARIVGAKLQDLNLTSVRLVFDVEVANPYGAPLPLAGLDYGLSSAGNSFLQGSIGPQGSVPAKSSRMLQVPATLGFASLYKTLSGVSPGAVIPYEASLTLSVDAPVLGRLALPLRREGELPVPAAPNVELTSVEWKSLDMTRAEAVLHLNVTNKNRFPLELTQLAYDLSLGDTKVAAASSAQGAKFGPGGSADLSVPITLRPIDLGLSAFRMFSGKGGGYKIAGKISGGTPFGPVDLPYEETGQTVFQRGK